MFKKIFVVGIMISILAITGCASTQSQQTQQSEAGSNTPTSPATQTVLAEQPVKNLHLNFEELYPNPEEREYAKSFIGKKAPEMVVTNTNGDQIRLSDFKGKNVLLEFGQTTCSACHQTFPVIETFRKKHADVVVLQAYTGESTETILKYLKDNNHENHNGILTGDASNTSLLDYQVKWTPTLFFIDKNGFVSFVHIGSLPIEDLESMNTLSFGEEIIKQ